MNDTRMESNADSQAGTAGVAVVAGAGPGLGSAVARLLSAQGWQVATLSRHAPAWPANAQPRGSPGRVTAVACDLTDADAVDRAMQQIEREMGAPSALIYNAAQLVRGEFLTLPAAAFEATWRVGVLGAVHCAQRVLPAMLNAARGTLIFTGATAAMRGGKGFSAFASAKFALRGLSQSLAREFGPQGVHVAHVVLDGAIGAGSGNANSGGQISTERTTFIDPDAIARTYLQLIEQPASCWTQEIDLRPHNERF